MSKIQHIASLQVWELEAALDAKSAVCDRLDRQLQLSANQLQRQHEVEDRCSEAQRRLQSAETTIQDLQADMQVSQACCHRNNSKSQCR